MKHYLDLVPISAKNPQEAKQNVYFLHCAGGISGYNYFWNGRYVHPQPDFEAQQESGNWHIALRISAMKKQQLLLHALILKYFHRMAYSIIVEI